MKTNKTPYVTLALIVILASILVLSLSYHTVAAQSYQTWTMTTTTSSGSHSGSLSVDSNCGFTSSDFTGNSPSEGTYTIYLNGQMS